MIIRPLRYQLCRVRQLCSLTRLDEVVRDRVHRVFVHLTHNVFFKFIRVLSLKRGMVGLLHGIPVRSCSKQTWLVLGTIGWVGEVVGYRLDVLFSYE